MLIAVFYNKNTKKELVYNKSMKRQTEFEGALAPIIFMLVLCGVLWYGIYNVTKLLIELFG